MSDSATPWTTAQQTSLSSTISPSLLKFIPTEMVMLSNHLILCHPLLLFPLIFPSIRVFSDEWTLCNMWPKYWRFSFRISSSNEMKGHYLSHPVCGILSQQPELTQPTKLVFFEKWEHSFTRFHAWWIPTVAPAPVSVSSPISNLCAPQTAMW